MMPSNPAYDTDAYKRAAALCARVSVTRWAAEQEEELQLQFVWDPAKAAENFAKHGVSFEEASTAFRDTLSATGPDPDHSVGEERFITFGVSTSGRLLIVAHTELGDTIRIITARPAKSGERKIYEEGQPQTVRRTSS